MRKAISTVGHSAWHASSFAKFCTSIYIGGGGSEVGAWLTPSVNRLQTLWNFILSAALGVQKLIVDFCLDGLLPGAPAALFCSTANPEATCLQCCMAFKSTCKAATRTSVTGGVQARRWSPRRASSASAGGSYPTGSTAGSRCSQSCICGNIFHASLELGEGSSLSHHVLQLTSSSCHIVGRTAIRRKMADQDSFHTQEWGAECSSALFELPHFAVELLIVLPTVQIICSRLRILALPQLRVVVSCTAASFKPSSGTRLETEQPVAHVLCLLRTPGISKLFVVWVRDVSGLGASR